MPDSTLTDAQVAATSITPEGVTTRRIVTSAQIEQEYVAASGFGFSLDLSFGRALPPFIDDLTADLGIDTYHDMRHDPQIESALDVLIDAITVQGYHLEAAVETGKPGYALAQQIYEFCLANIESLDTPIMECFREMLLSIAYGHKVAELVFEIRPYQGTQRVFLTRIKPKPLHSTAFVVDRANNTLAILAINRALNSFDLNFDPTVPNPNLLPRGKFWVETNDGENGDPRGTSDLRSAYHSWWFKAQLWKGLLEHTATFASPSVIGFTDPDAELPIEKDKDGNILPQRSKEQVMLEQLMKIQNRACGAFPGKARVEVLEPKTAGDVFFAAIGLANNEMIHAIMGQTLMTQEGAHMSRSAATTHQDVFGLIVRRKKQRAEDRFRRDVLHTLVAQNWGDANADLYTPKFTLGVTEHQDFAQFAGAIARLWEVGFFDQESQAVPLDALLAVPARDTESWQRRLDLDRRIDEAALAPPAPPAGAGGGAGGLGQQVVAQTQKQISRQAGGRVAANVGKEGV